MVKILIASVFSKDQITSVFAKTMIGNYATSITDGALRQKLRYILTISGFSQWLGCN